MAAPVLMIRPMKVRTLGEMRVSARPFTIACSSTPQPRPKALVQVIRATASLRSVVNGSELEDLEFAFAVGCHDGDGVANLRANQTASYGRGGRDEALVHI